MTDSWVAAQAPSNIALIKYMGKKDSNLNIPENSSISLTLNSLCSVAEISCAPASASSVIWVPETPRARPESLPSHFEMVSPALQDEGIGKVIRHFERVSKMASEVFPAYGLALSEDGSQKRQLTVRSANTFPSSSGIASSASSFAALTLASALACAKDPDAFERAWNQEPQLRRVLSRVSRQGSGSSCRSFEGPWVLWEAEDAAAMNTPQMPEVAHFVILIKTEPKKISSSAAHLMVRTSPLWEARVERVESRTRLMMAALGKADFSALARIAWSESWEMHSLFHTCVEPFSYWEPGTVDALHWFAPLIREPSPPIVTLDAGPNIHVIVEKQYRNVWRERLKANFTHSTILEDEQGSGATRLGVL